MFPRPPLCAALVAAFAGLSLPGAPVFAQTESTAPNPGLTPAADPPAPKSLERVEVTGTRIKRVDLETSQPILVLRRADILARGLTSLGDVVRGLAANGSAGNTTTNFGGNGETNVSLRNLGDVRTLVLVNGRRWVGGTGLGGAVDLNTIPTAAVERIELLKDGGSVIYGSDAISGVINIILRQDFEGVEFNAYAGQYQQGDGQRQSLDVTWGKSGEGYRALLGAGYVNEASLGAGERALSAEPKVGTGTALGSTTTPFGRYRVCNGTWDSASGACSGPQTRPDGSAGQFTYSPGQSGLNWRNFSNPDDLYNYAPDQYLRTPQERFSLFGNASFDLSEDTRLKLQASLNRRLSGQQLAAVPLALGAATTSAAGRAITMSPDSLYNPFGQTVSAIQRRVVETGPRSIRQDVTTLSASAELEGTVTWANKPYAWNVGVLMGNNRQDRLTTGNLALDPLKNGLGPSMLDASGKAVCVGTAGDLSTVIPGCVPVNLLGAPGTLTPDMLAYTQVDTQYGLGYRMAQLYAGLSGELAQLPAGPMRFAAGLEHRRESGYDRPGSLLASGQTSAGSRTVTEGGYAVNEAYAELDVPVLKNLPAVKALDLSLGARHSRYQNFGSTTNAKVGATWRINSDVMLRGNWSQGFRAPSVLELYKGPADTFEVIADPCSTNFGGYYADLTAGQQSRCHAQGVPVGGYEQSSSQVRAVRGGNTALRPETSVSQTFGLVASPSFAPGLDVSLDWWRISIKNLISELSGQELLKLCIEDGKADSCALFGRGAGGEIDRLRLAAVNFGGLESQGYDLTLNYRLPRTRLGTFSVGWDTTFVQNYEWDGNGENLVGKYFDSDNHWRLRSNLNLAWQKDSLGANWGLRYFSAQTEDCNLPAGYTQLCSDPGNRQNHIGATTYHDVSGYWVTPWKGRITLGVNNLFNRAPPTSYAANSNSFDTQYEIPGRFVYLRYSQRF